MGIWGCRWGIMLCLCRWMGCSVESVEEAAWMSYLLQSSLPAVRDHELAWYGVGAYAGELYA